MKKTIPTLLLAAFLLVFTAPLLLAGPEDSLIKRGDKFFGNRGKGVKWCEKAIECYEKALAVNVNSVEASWRIARACYWLGMHTDGDDAKLKIYKKGIDVAKRAVSLDDKSVASHFWCGVSYGKYGEAKGVTSSLGLVEPIKKEMNRVLELDEKFEAGGGHRVLGRLYFKLPGIAGGDNEKAVDHLKKAIAIDETRLLNHLFIAQVYVGIDDKENAKKHLEFIINAPFEAHRKPENEEEKAEAKKMLEEL